MKTSKYAPKTPSESLAQSKAEKLKRDQDRAARLLGRLRWKAELLMVSYFRTMEIVQSIRQQDGRNSAQHSMESGASSQQAESMFKIDFFEFYTLLERYITDCLANLGASISASVPRNFNALRYITDPDLHRTRPMASHAFHANLLEALDDKSCPLHSSLGTQDVRIQLGIAKEYRNAWKDAGEKSSASSWNGENGDARKNIKLQDLQLELMLRAIILGCEHANVAVQGHTAPNFKANGHTSSDFEPPAYGYTAMDTEDTPFEYMDDAMDLD